MNAVEIEEAVSALAQAPFQASEFPYAFLMAFGNKDATIKRLRSGVSNKSDVGGVLQVNNIHIAIADAGQVGRCLEILKASPATSKSKARFLVASDGIDFEAEDMETGETVACLYEQFPDHFGFFLPLAGISTVKQIRESSFDIRATARLNRLYVELLKDNPDWGTPERRHDLNQLMARLIFCFFAEDTNIFSDPQLFTQTIEKMSERDSSNTHFVIHEVFRAMDTKIEDRAESKLPRWADAFPYVNGGLFSGSGDVPRFSKISRSYLLHIGSLDWTRINPDIFGSMIQAVADDDERGDIGMHYTSVPNILKVLNPLFLDDLREKFSEAGDNPRTLLNLRKRISRIRVFDPACGSGNFLVVAYKQMREIEHVINVKRGEGGRPSEIPLTNFRGIEIRGFSAEIARLALVIAEFQCDLLYLGQQEAAAVFLPLDSQNWITCGNALRIDWLSVCPPNGSPMKANADDLFQTPLDQPLMDFENEGGETYICGNPPYVGSTWQSADQKNDLKEVFDHRTKGWKSLDYVAGWFMKASDYGTYTQTAAAFVSTNSICQGQQVPILWPLVFAKGYKISFAHTSFKWTNLASHNAGVTVVIVAISNQTSKIKRLFLIADEGVSFEKQVDYINAYLVPGPNAIVGKIARPLGEHAEMIRGNMPYDGGNLLLTGEEVEDLNLTSGQRKKFIRRIYGSAEFIRGLERYCLWIQDDYLDEALKVSQIAQRIDGARRMRQASTDKGARDMAKRAHQLREMNIGKKHALVVAGISSENRPYLPCGLLSSDQTGTNKLFVLYDAPLWNMALIASRLHWVWIGTVCVRMRTDFSYSNTLGWNTFPVPKLTDKNKDDLTRAAVGILLAREAHYPATIADLYDPATMPADLREAHDRNDEILERIYIGRRFRNDTERLETLFDLYTKMTSKRSSKAH